MQLKKTMEKMRKMDIQQVGWIKRNGNNMRSCGKFSTAVAIIVTLTVITSPFTAIGQWSPDDTHFNNGNQWNLKGDIGGGGFDYAWDLSDQGDKTNPGSNEIVVAVIDTGINLDHEDLQDILWTNRLDPPGDADGVDDDDDDGNGFDDDIHGWNFYEGNADIDDEGYSDGFMRIYHGTATAGIIASTLDNNMGIAGGAEVSIMPLRAFGDGYVAKGEETVAGYFAAAVAYARNNGADIISISYTFDQDWPSLGTQIENAYADGCVIIASVENNDTRNVTWPAFYDEVIAVGGMRIEDLGGGQFDHYRDQTNISYGNGSIKFDIGSATGEKLDLIGARTYYDGSETYLTVPWGHDDGDAEGRNDSYNVNGIVDGLWDPVNWSKNSEFFIPTCANSFVAPQVAATAALMLSVRPSLTNDQVYEILRATANDVTHDVTTAQTNLFGHDIYSGYGALDTHEAVRFANNWANRWGEDKKVSDLVQTATIDRASIDVDSMGYSHIVWIDDFRHEICYRSLDPNGNVYYEAVPLEANTPSRRCEEPRVRADRENNIHIAWLRRETPLQNPEIRYTKMSPSGTALIGPKFIVHDSGTAWKFDLNLLTTDDNPQNNNPTAIVIYTKKANTRFDIWMNRVDSNGGNLAGFPKAVVSDNFDEIRVTAAIFNLEQQHQRNEYIHLVFKDSNSTLGNYDLQWMVIQTDGTVFQQEQGLVNNGNSVDYPDIDCIYDEGNAAVTWTENGRVMYAMIDAAGNHHTYSEGHDPVQITSSNGHEGTRVAISQRDMDTRTCQVDILHTKNWEVYLSELSFDGRVIKSNNFGAQTLALCPEIVGIKDDSHISDFYDNTGNFFMVYCGDVSLGVGSDIYWRSTGFSSCTPDELYYDDEEDVIDTYVTVDIYGGIHVVYSRTSYDSIEVFYQYFSSAASLPNPDGFELCVSDQEPPGETDGNDSYSPRIETICYYDEDEEEDMVQVYFFWLDEKVNSKARIYMRAIEFSTDMMNEHDLLDPDIQPCDFSNANPTRSIQDYDTNLQINGVNATDDNYTYYFYITWADDNSWEIELAELDLMNSASQSIEVSNGTHRPTDPSVVSDWNGDAYVVYNSEDQILLTKITHITGNLAKVNTSEITSSNDVSIHPTISIDRNINRIEKKSETYGALPNDYYSDRGMKFLHITCMMETATQGHFIPMYYKYDTDRTEVISHSILPATSNIYYSETGLQMYNSLDCDNRMVIGIQGKMDIGQNPEWRDTSQFQGIHVMRLDNNGDFLVHESLVSHDGNIISYGDDVSKGNIAVDVHNPDTTYCVWISDKDGNDALYLTYSTST